jgi:hypothetical protein
MRRAPPLRGSRLWLAVVLAGSLVLLARSASAQDVGTGGAGGPPASTAEAGNKAGSSDSGNGNGNSNGNGNGSGNGNGNGNGDGNGKVTSLGCTHAHVHACMHATSASR